MSFKANTAAASLAALTMLACGSDEIIVPDAFLLAEGEATESQCPTGGLVLRSGPDLNANGVLDDSEVQDTQIVCNGDVGGDGNDGNDGNNALLRRSEEPAGANCENGGERIDAGVDDDGDGTLDDAEVDSTTYICTGATGPDAPTLLTEVDTDVESDCPSGGSRVLSGLDTDGDGALDEDEVQVSRLICNGADGTAYVYVVDTVAAGPECAAGGQRLRGGLDTNADGLLQTAEVTETEYICRPIASLTEVTPLLLGDARCASGGQRIDVGLDANGNGSLESAEVESTSFVCAGADGRRVLTSRRSEPNGTRCPAGGERFAVGFDADGDLLLDAGEEVQVSYTCNGSTGEPGTQGSAVNVAPEAAGANCPNGGQRIEVGPDSNGNGSLDPIEVVQTSYACNSAAAGSVLTELSPEPPGSNCANGGRRLVLGIDLDQDGSLGAAEIVSTAFVCSSVAQVPIGITTTEFPPAIPNRAYSAAIEALGGIGAGYTWSLAGGALPSGLSLDPTGTPSTRLSGTPSSAGSFDFTIRVTDLNANSTTRAFRLEVQIPLSISERAVPAFVPGQPYSFNLSGTGGTAPYSFAVVDSRLPAGLSLDASGLLSGTPSGRYGSHFLVEITDGTGDRFRGAYTLRGPRSFYAGCGDVLVDATEDLILGQVGAATATVVATPEVGGNRIAVSCPDVAFSPASDLIAVVGDDGSGSDELYLVDFSAYPTVTSTRVGAPLGNSAFDVTEIAWSPDGNYIAYRGDFRADGEIELRVANVSNPSAVTVETVNGPLVNLGDVLTDFRFSPDSRRLVYLADERLDGQNEVFVYDLTTSQNLGVANGALFDTSDDVDDGFEISADSKYLLYAAEQNARDLTDLFLVRIDGATLGVPVQVNPELVSGGDIGETTLPADDDYGFSATGAHIAYVADQDTDNVGQVYLVSTESPGQSTRFSGIASSTLLEVFDIQWDHFGRQLLMRGDLAADAVNELFVADVASPAGEPMRVNDELLSTGDVETTTYGVSPDNSYFYYEADQIISNDEEPFVVFRVDLGKANISRRVLAGTFAGDNTLLMVPSSDGSNLVVVVDASASTTEYEAFAVTISGTTLSAPTRVNLPFTTADQDVSTTQCVNVADDYFLYLADETTDNETEVSLYDIVNQTRAPLVSSLPTGGDASTAIAQEL